MNHHETKGTAEGTVGRDDAAGTPRRSLREWMAVRLDIPADVTGGGLRLDLRGRNTLTVHGCTGILDFNPCEVRLAVKDATLTVRGCRLICTAYLAGAVGIEGHICGMSFSDGEVQS
ncbi:MAG: YabP/YqfC family sporulation protein [Clostridia bacterium]|nr:YabP/YqfC family sporulation protein [Clostridia bacterium]